MSNATQLDRAARRPDEGRGPAVVPPWFPFSRWDALLPDLLDGLTPQQSRAFYAQCTPRVFPTRTEILSQGEDTACAFLVVEGRVEVTFVDVDGNTIIAHVAGPGEVLGEVELLSDKPCAATCRAMPNSRLLVFNAALLMRHVPTEMILRNFARILHGRLIRDNCLQAIAQFYPAEARICLHLLRLTTDERHELHLSQAQLALLAGCSRQTVNRTLAALRAEHIIELRRGVVRVLDPDRLTHKRLSL